MDSVACTDNLKDEFSGLAEEINKQYPNTKVIGYPYKYSSEEETLQLVDDILNQWGRYENARNRKKKRELIRRV